MGVFAAGCASSESSTNTSSGPSAAQSSETWSPSDVVAELRSAADEWKGTPHDLGGTSQHGVDCSGLVQSVYTDRFQHSVPRTTEKQVRAGVQVSRSDLQPGDLVFFRPGWKKRHVGIYVSDGEFLHASSSQGVAISSLDKSYWTERWWQARRLLPLSNDDPDAASAPPSSSSSNASSSRGSGW